MEQALYRKYRPLDFKSAIAQDHIVTTLKNAIEAGRISHAYLFTGPRGVGKTSIARILAHEINGLEYSDDSIHLDIIEIDAASNRRIDEIRDLRDKVRIAPAVAKYKVYIIDEVHMLTREAFNALLKTLEEPPAHSVFILATTEAHKLPDTIISRTQRFEFKPVNPVQMAEHLKTIAKKEKIDITFEALELLAKYGDGSFRDSIGYLDQLSTHQGKIDEETVRKVLGMPSKEEVDTLLSALKAGDVKAAARNFDVFQSHGINAAELSAGLSEALRSKIVSGDAEPWHTGLLKDLVQIKGSPRPQELLEITVLDWAVQNSNRQPGQPAESDSHGNANAVQPASMPKLERKKKTPDDAPSNFDLANWQQVVEAAKTKAASIYTALRLARPIMEDGRLILHFEFPLHQKKLDQAKNKRMVSDIISELFNEDVDIECIVNKDFKKQPAVVSSDPEQGLHAISNIFGGAEMMET